MLGRGKGVAIFPKMHLSNDFIKAVFGARSCIIMILCINYSRNSIWANLTELAGEVIF